MHQSLSLTVRSCRLVFLWVMVPWLQRDVDTLVHQFNNSARRADKNKVLPQGIPSLIAAKPDRFGVLDFKVRDHCHDGVSK